MTECPPCRSDVEQRIANLVALGWNREEATAMIVADEARVRTTHPTTSARPIYRWTKLDNGQWAILGADVPEGTVVMVDRQNGTSSQETLGRKWSTGDGVSLYVPMPRGHSPRRHTELPVSLYAPKPQGYSSRRHPERLPSQNYVPTKRCWECGREFTYQEAKQNEGDWRDSYCGC